MIVTLSYFEFIELIVSLNHRLFRGAKFSEFKPAYALGFAKNCQKSFLGNSSCLHRIPGNLLALTLTCVKLLQGLNVYCFELLNQPL